MTHGQHVHTGVTRTRGAREHENSFVETRARSRRHTGAQAPGRAEGYNRDANAGSQLHGSCRLSPTWPLPACEAHAPDSPTSRAQGLSSQWT